MRGPVVKVYANRLSCFGRWVEPQYNTPEKPFERVQTVHADPETFPKSCGTMVGSVYIFFIFVSLLGVKREKRDRGRKRWRGFLHEMRGNGCGCVLPDRKTRSDHRYQLSRRYPSVIRNVIHRWVPLDSRDDAVSFPFLYSPFRLLFSPATGETRLHFEEFRVDRARAIYPRSSNTLLRPSGTRKSKGN